jgi:aerobic carbon-monoxide dehydrogenase large subunit
VTLIGKRVRRLEDHPLLTGRACFAADISFPNQLHMRVVRSPVAHGRLLDVDSTEALGTDGVIAVWTGRNVADIPPIDFRQEGLTELAPYRQPVLACGWVRYVGEPLAVVFAEDAYVAEDAADLVFADIKDAPATIDPRGPAGRFDEEHDTAASQIHIGYGDVGVAFRDAHDHVSVEVAVGRHTGVPLETRGGVAVIDDDGVLHLHGAAKLPHYNRAAIAAMLGLSRNSIQLHEGHVGGGFGIRGELYPEDVLLCLGALRLHRPVKWIEDRREHLLAANHSRDQIHHIEAAIDADGFVRGVKDTFWLDQGAYIRTHAATVPNLTAAMLPGPYLFPAYEATGHIVLTNKTPAGTYRSPGRYEGTFARERLMDAVAHRVGLDGAEVRRRNLIRPTQMPFARPIRALGTDLEYDSGDYPRLLQRALEHLDYTNCREELGKRRAAGEMVGLGLGLFVEKSGLGPFDGVKMNVDGEGGVRIITGVASMGQGVETVIAQVCADVLDVELDAITVSHGQTHEIGMGMGAFASRVTVMTGTATYLAAQELRDRLLERAGQLLEAAPSDLVLRDGGIEVAGAPHIARLNLKELAAASEGGDDLSSESWFTTDHLTYPYGLHAAIVRVDGETGATNVLRYLVAYDVGRAVNPMLVEGQIVGGTAQGIGGALLEEFIYDANGQPLASSFVDYLLPTTQDCPAVEVLLSEDAPSTLNPLGLKGAGEGGVTAAGAAIAAAIDDAIAIPGAITRLPVSPERMRSILNLRDGNRAGRTPIRGKERVE